MREILALLLTLRSRCEANLPNIGDGGIMGRVMRKTELSSRELMQLMLWGGLLLFILLGLVYGLVRAGAVIPVGSAVERHATTASHGDSASSRP